MRWFFRLTIPLGMIAGSIYGFAYLWHHGWLWNGYPSYISLFIGFVGVAWFIADFREFLGPRL